MVDFFKGMDISFLPEYKDKGMIIKDFDGTPIESFEMLKKYGVNAIRLRIWNQPNLVPESKGYCSFSHTLAMAKQIKANNMHFLLDFHYSDYWADPGQQRKPKSWENLSFEELENAVYIYTKEVLMDLKKEGVMPDMVQIGNEIRSGLLFPEGEVPNYKQMVQLVNAGIKAARDVDNSHQLQVMIHLDQGGRYSLLKEWFDQAFKHGLMDFDVMGLSYYPFWHGTFLDLKTTMSKLIQAYNKPIMIVETAHAWRIEKDGFINEEQEKTAGVKANEEGQYQVLNTIMNLMVELPNKMGLGIYYWEPLCIPEETEGGWASNMGLLDETGKIMKGMEAFLFTRENYDASICAEENLPKPEVHSTCIVNQGTLDKNYLNNGDWDLGFLQWSITKSEEQVQAELVKENYSTFDETKINSLHFKSFKNFMLDISQIFKIYEPGAYSLEVEFMGTDTTGVNVSLYLETSKGRQKTIIHPAEHNWSKYVIQDVICEKEEIKIGVAINSPPIYGKLCKFALKRRRLTDECRVQL